MKQAFIAMDSGAGALELPERLGFELSALNFQDLHCDSKSQLPTDWLNTVFISAVPFFFIPLLPSLRVG